ncbi:unnamed protein product [Linum trigynum]|uniref:F-box domain-containing protein n=1 Tax=Linum trigynum TaxID=586398 RepID=A0AAV2GV01_9ROSI
MGKRRRLETNGYGETNQIPTGEEEVDRISELPDDVIHKILTRVEPSKKAAKTSVLSQRWANLWRSYPVLEFHDTQFATKKSAKRFAAAAKKKFGCSSSDDTLITTAIQAV